MQQKYLLYFRYSQWYPSHRNKQYPSFSNVPIEFSFAPRKRILIDNKMIHLRRLQISLECE